MARWQFGRPKRSGHSVKLAREEETPVVFADGDEGDVLAPVERQDVDREGYQQAGGQCDDPEGLDEPDGLEDFPEPAADISTLLNSLDRWARAFLELGEAAASAAVYTEFVSKGLALLLIRGEAEEGGSLPRAGFVLLAEHPQSSLGADRMGGCVPARMLCCGAPAVRTGRRGRQVESKRLRRSPNGRLWTPRRQGICMDVTGGADSIPVRGDVQRDQVVSTVSMFASTFCPACSGSVAAALHWVSFDDVHALLGRPSRVDPQGRLVWAHAMTRRSYLAVASACVRSGRERSARASVRSCLYCRRARGMQRRPSLQLSAGSRGVTVAAGRGCGQRCPRHRWLLPCAISSFSVVLFVPRSPSPLAAAVTSASATPLAAADAGAFADMSPLIW